MTFIEKIKSLMGTSKANPEDSIYNIKQNIAVNPELYLTFVRFVTKTS